MLVINQQLYVPRPHEHVCVKCGRVASPGARFCQCRAPLLRACWSCLAENPIDDEVCSQCGSPMNSPDEKLFWDCVDADIEEDAKRKKNA